MDNELLICLCVLWFSSTAAMITFMSMWLFNEGKIFWLYIMSEYIDVIVFITYDVCFHYINQL